MKRKTTRKNGRKLTPKEFEQAVRYFCSVQKKLRGPAKEQDHEVAVRVALEHMLNCPRRRAA